MTDFKVLIVDDEEELVTTIAERLELRGIKTITATDGKSALDIIESDPPRVVVLDLMMPGIGGIEILKWIDDRNLAIPVILLTGYSAAHPELEQFKTKAFDILIKPCDLSTLMNKIQEAAKIN